MCTGISYTSTDKQEFFGRTQEYNLDYDYVIAQFPPEYSVAIAANTWVTKYSVLGVTVKVQDQIAPTVLDGINQFGLACSTQYFADEFVYSSLADITANNKKPIYAEQFIFFILSMCKDVQDVKNILETIAIPDESILNIIYKGQGGTPQHFFIKDSSGSAIVVEPSVKLGFKVYENPVGVMTNSPSFDWHLTNLRNYVGSSNLIQKSLNIGKATISSFSKGSGMIGIPGDFTAPSRFVKAAILLNFAERVPAKNAANLCFHILSMSDIPKGVMLCNDSSFEYTQYTSIYNQTDKIMFIKMYDNLNIQKVTFDANLTKNDPIRVYNLVKEEQYLELKPSL